MYIGGAVYPTGYFEAGDEIAIFDGDLLVGVFVLTQVCTPENQLENVLNAFSQLFSGQGYTVGNTISFKAWIQSMNLEFGLFYYFTNPYVFAFPSSEALFEFRFCRNALRSRRLLLKQRTPHCATLKVKRSFT